MATLVKEVVADLHLQAENRYHKVPFQVPAGVPSLGVQVSFDRDRGVIDLGCEGPNGWRGWSGGARTEFTIGLDAATPGYLPGPIESGSWAVVLGLHNLPDGPVPVRVKITFPSEVEIPPQVHVPVPAPVRRGSERNLPAPSGKKWYAGDPHNHTFHSDGSLSIEELAALGVEMGLDYLGVTDHNTISHQPFLPQVSKEYGITLIPGQEVTTHRGHANAYGDIGWVDFREPVDNWVHHTHSRGGMFSINHAIDADCSWVSPLSEPPSSVELWHSSWFRDIYGDGIFAWLSLQDRNVTLLGGSDFHRLEGPQRPGVPTTWVLAASNSAEDLLAGMREGRTTITGTVTEKDGVAVPELFNCPILLRQDDESILALDARGLVFSDFMGSRTIIDAERQLLTAPKDSGPYSLYQPDRRIVALSP